jgi:hypothetical protein
MGIANWMLVNKKASGSAVLSRLDSENNIP